MDEYTEGEISEEDLKKLEDPVESANAPLSTPTINLPEPLYRVKVKHSSETLFAFFDSPQEVPHRKDVVLATRYGRDLGIVLGIVKNPGFVDPEEIVPIERIASTEDEAKYSANEQRAKDAFAVCKQKIEAHRLNMKLVSAHYLLDEPKVLFFFTAESRVDFRELVKDLVSVFKMRIELRQIGVRDEARVLGGAGVCGRHYCCHGITDKLNAVSIKMAKDQNLSLNSMKISGPCGRLLCCLSYEYHFYRDERRNMPLEGARFQHDGTTFRILEINVLQGTIKLSGEDGRIIEYPASRFARGENGRWIIVDAPQTEEVKE